MSRCIHYTRSRSYLVITVTLDVSTCPLTCLPVDSVRYMWYMSCNSIKKTARIVINRLILVFVNGAAHDPKVYNIACSAFWVLVSFSPTNWVCFNLKILRKYRKWPDWCEFHQISRQWDQNSKIRWTELDVIMFWVNVRRRSFKIGLYVEWELNTWHGWNYIINHAGTTIGVRIMSELW